MKDILLLDEPLTGVDLETKKNIIKNLKEFLKDRIVFIASHDEFVREIANRVLELQC